MRWEVKGVEWSGGGGEAQERENTPLFFLMPFRSDQHEH
jgi:hypothetical protein